MMEDNKGCRNQLIFGAIWLLGGFINLIVFRLVLNEDSLLANMLPFILPALSFIAGTRLMQVKDFMLVGFWAGNLSQIESEGAEPKKKIWDNGYSCLCNAFLNWWISYFDISANGSKSL
jgi:hypothetical protein